MVHKEEAKSDSIRSVFCGLGHRPLMDGKQAPVALFAKVEPGQNPDDVRRQFASAVHHGASTNLAAIDVRALAARADAVEATGNHAQANEIRRALQAPGNG